MKSALTEMGLSVSSPLSGVESEGKSPPLPCLSFAGVQGPPPQISVLEQGSHVQLHVSLRRAAALRRGINGLCGAFHGSGLGFRV